MLRKLVILLEKKYITVIGEKYLPQFERLRLEMQKSGVFVRWNFLPPQKVGGSSLSGQEEVWRDEKRQNLKAPGEIQPERYTDCLCITDSPENYDLLKRWGYCVAALIHEGNQGAVFKGNAYVLEGPDSLECYYLNKVYQRLAGLPWDILETRHLAVRESTVGDVEEFYRIYRDPSITCYMENLFQDPEQEKAYMKNYIRQVYGFYGYGLWTVLLKETGQVIGRAGLSVREGYDLPELGFVIETAQQRKGYAYEVCRAILEYAKDELEFGGVQALVKAENQASVGLLKKLGFRYRRNVKENDTDYQLYIFSQKAVDKKKAE